MNVVIDGAAIFHHQTLAQKFIASSALCTALGLCQRAIVAYSRTETSDDDIDTALSATCSKIHEVYREALESPELAKLTELGLAWLVIDLYSITKTELDHACRSIARWPSKGVKMDRWSEAVERALREYLAGCISSTLVNLKEFRNALAGDFENWLKEPVTELCRERAETSVIVLTHDEGLEEYGNGIGTCYAKYINCSLKLEVIRDTCEKSAILLLARMVSLSEER